LPGNPWSPFADWPNLSIPPVSLPEVAGSREIHAEAEILIDAGIFEDLEDGGGPALDCVPIGGIEGGLGDLASSPETLSAAPSFQPCLQLLEIWTLVCRASGGRRNEGREKEQKDDNDEGKEVQRSPPSERLVAAPEK
jgi:hypothetical protein